MKIKLLQSRSGPTGSNIAGDEIEVDDATAERMIAKGQAERVGAKRGRPPKPKNDPPPPADDGDGDDAGDAE